MVHFFFANKFSHMIIIRKWDKLGELFRKKERINENGIVETFKEFPYEQVIQYVKKSKCIIDLVQANQAGMTMRVMEGLIYKRKVITNNKNIVFEKLYHKNNFLLLIKTILMI